MQWVFISSTDLGRNLSCSHWLRSWIVMFHHKLYFWECLFWNPKSTIIQFYTQPTLHQKPFLNTNVPIQHTKNSSDTNRLSLYYGIKDALSHTCITDLCTHESWCLLKCGTEVAVIQLWIWALFLVPWMKHSHQNAKENIFIHSP